MERTRARITQAAIDLHGSIGPAATTMSAVAERAGVTRATLSALPQQRDASQGVQRRVAERQPGT
jgi:transcriptional regulator with XRE-family HTH domain